MDLKFTKKGIEVLNAFTDPVVRGIVTYGGQGSGKSYSVIQILTYYAMNASRSFPKSIAMMAESHSKLEIVLINTWKTIMGDTFERSRWNASRYIYTFPNKSEIRFLSAHNTNPNFYEGYRPHIIYFDEISNIRKTTYDQFSRTREKIICSFNPSREFYIKDVMDQRNDYVTIHSTYKDNPYIEPAEASDIEMKSKFDKNFREVYMLGKWGSYDGNIFNEEENFFVVPELPNKIKGWEHSQSFGLDLGWNDPNALVEINHYINPNTGRDVLYLKEHLYKGEMINSELAKAIRTANPKNINVIIESARPEIRQDLMQTYKLKLTKANKPKGSIIAGITRLKQYEILLDDTSINLIKEFRNYSWKKDKSDKTLDIPIDNWNHLLDALRYGLQGLRRGKGPRAIRL